VGGNWRGGLISLMRICLSLKTNTRVSAAALSLALLLACAAISSAQTRRPPRRDTQVWSDVQLAVPLSKKIDFVMLGTLRLGLGNNFHHFVDERIGMGFSFKVGKYLTFFPNYLHITTHPFDNRFGTEERLTFPLTVRFPLGKFTVSDRNQFERRFRQPQGDSTRYRNRLQIEHPFKINSTKFNWFVADEVFYDWSVNDWVRNRFTLGASHKFNNHFTGDLYYLRQNDGRTNPGDVHVIGTTFRLRM